MEMRRLFAENMKEALMRVRDELGDDALIVETRTVEGGVEVLASQDLPSPRLTPKAPQATDIDEIRLMDRDGVQRALIGSDVAQKQIDLWLTGFDAARPLVSLAAQLPVDPRPAAVQSGQFCVIGTTGSGKTNLVAHLVANHALRFGAASVAMVTLDTWRAGGVDALKSIGRLLNVPVLVARETTDLPHLLKTLSGRSLVVVDTPGISLHRTGINEARRLLAPVAELMPLVLVVPTTLHERPLNKTFTEFARFVDGVCVSHLDEPVPLGPVLSHVVDFGRSLWWQLGGCNLPDDLEAADALGLARRLLSETQISDAHPPDGRRHHGNAINS